MSRGQHPNSVNRNEVGPIVEIGDRDISSYYRSGDFLRSKHRRTSFDSGREFQRWALDLLTVSPDWRILDAGCGWGRFTWSLVDDYSIPAGQIACSDLSPGMLRTACEEALLRSESPTLCAADIEALPFRSDTFQLVIAAHVLYHLPDIDHGIRELARVIDPRGYLLITTNSDRVYPLIIDLHYSALQALDISFVPEQPSHFSMENGRQRLSRAFGLVTAHYFEDSTTFPDVAAFLNLYTTIGRYRMVMENESIELAKRQRLASEVGRLAGQALDATGALKSPGLLGSFVCQEPIV